MTQVRKNVSLKQILEMWSCPSTESAITSSETPYGFTTASITLGRDTSWGTDIPENIYRYTFSSSGER